MEKLNIIEKFLAWVKKYGFFHMVETALVILIFSWTMYFSFHPEIIYERVISHIEAVHDANQQTRAEASIKIRYELSELLEELNADRAWVIEYHNGTSGLGGLPFTFGIMNSEECKEGIRPVSQYYRDFLLSDYLLLLETSKQGEWAGNVESIKPFDPRTYYTFKSNDINEMAFFFLKSENKDIGLIGVSYCFDNKMPSNAADVLRKYGIKTSLILNK